MRFLRHFLIQYKTPLTFFKEDGGMVNKREGRGNGGEGIWGISQTQTWDTNPSQIARFQSYEQLPTIVLDN